MRTVRTMSMRVVFLAGLFVGVWGCHSAELQSRPAPTTQPTAQQPLAASESAAGNQPPAVNQARPAPATAPDLAAELAELRTKWLKDLGPGHSAAVQAPFLVIVVGAQREADYWLKGTVVESTQRIQKQYMKARPDKPLVILLFSGQKPYREVCKRVLNEDSPPHYGFFRPWERLLVMDIDTGGGTLVHELTHAMIAFDFPKIPDWFNEGLGSLYEQCEYSPDGKLRGLPNWRLPALQQAIRDKKLGTLAELTSVDFRGENMGMNYAQARYLCHYMQDLGKLEAFYRAFRDGYEQDATGLKFLKAAFASKSLDDVEKEWRKWVLTLRFGR